MEDLEQRIERFERNLAYMHGELTAIKEELGKDEARVSQPKSVAKPARPKAEPTYVATNVPPKAPLKRKEGKSAEQFIGKVAMGIGASILIFIAMVMFATLIIPMFNDTMKMVSMYVLSIGLIAAGEFVYKKSKTGYTILSACGVGALFISFVATCVYFHAIGQVALYILLLLWVFGVAFHMARNRNLAFVVVGQIGVIVATILSAFSDNGDMDYYLMIGFILLAEAIFFISFFRKKFIIDLINVSSLVISIMILDGIAYANFANVGPMAAIVFVGCIAITGAAMYLYSKKLNDMNGLLSRIFNVFACLMFAFLVGSVDRVLVIDGDVLRLVCIVYMVLMLIIGDRFGGTKGLVVTRSVQICIILVLGLAMAQTGRLSVYLALMLFAMLYGWLAKDRYYYFITPVTYIFIVGLDIPLMLWSFSDASSLLLVDNAFPIIAMFSGLVVLVSEMVIVRTQEKRVFSV